MKQEATLEVHKEKTIEVSVLFHLMKIASFWIRWFFLICIAFIILYPMFYMVSMAFRSYLDFYDVTVVWITKTFTTDNFGMLFKHLGAGSALRHTLLITACSTLCQLIVTSMVGYGFGRFRFKGNNLLFALVIFTVMVPPQMLNLPNYLLMQDFDFFGLIRLITDKPTGLSLINSPLSFIIPSLLGQGLRAGLFILIFRQIYATLPKELEEAARIDGCGNVGIYLRVMLPNASNAFLISGIFSVVWYWTDYYTAATLLGSYRTMAMDIPELRTAATVILPMAERNVYRFIPMEQAACLLLILPLLIVFLLIQKFFTNSIDKTGLVG